MPWVRLVYSLIPGLPGARRALCQHHGISSARKRPGGSGVFVICEDGGSSKSCFPHCISDGCVHCKLKLEGLPLASELSPSPPLTLAGALGQAQEPLAGAISADQSFHISGSQVGR